MNKIISIFSGIDCLGLGFRHKFDTLLAVEEEVNACRTLEFNREKFHENLEVLNTDIFEVPDSKIKEYEGIDGVIGGPTCKAFSGAKGAFDPNDVRIGVLGEYVRWIRLAKPKFFLFENTKGIVEGKKKPYFFGLVKNLEELGYDVKYKVLNAHDYGSAQNRFRVIAVGFRKELNIDYEFPKPTEDKKYVIDILDTPGLEGEYYNLNEKRKELMPYIPEGGCWRDLPTEELKEKALGKCYKNLKGGMTGVCRRLHRDLPCPTITTSPSQNTTLMVHPTEDRHLSVTECKRGQGIPDDYKILGSTKEKYMFIGNGVPVELATCLATSIYEALEKCYEKELALS